MAASINDITGDSIISRDSENYKNNYSDVFKEEDKKVCSLCDGLGYLDPSQYYIKDGDTTCPKCQGKKFI